jgi:hypothetical protein
MFTILRGSSSYFEVNVIPRLDSKPQELMTFIVREFHPIARPPDLPIESSVIKLQYGSSEESLLKTSFPSPKVS